MTLLMPKSINRVPGICSKYNREKSIFCVVATDKIELCWWCFQLHKRHGIIMWQYMIAIGKGRIDFELVVAFILFCLAPVDDSRCRSVMTRWCCSSFAVKYQSLPLFWIKGVWCFEYIAHSFPPNTAVSHHLIFGFVEVKSHKNIDNHWWLMLLSISMIIGLITRWRLTHIL